MNQNFQKLKSDWLKDHLKRASINATVKHQYTFENQTVFAARLDIQDEGRQILDAIEKINEEFYSKFNTI